MRFNADVYRKFCDICYVGGPYCYSIRTILRMDMKLHSNLSDFNRRFADALLPTFPAGVKAFRSDDGTLLFRGLIPLQDDPQHVGTHVAVSLDKEVIAELEGTSLTDRDEKIKILISSLGTKVQMQYDPNKFGPDAIDVVGHIDILRS